MSEFEQALQECLRDLEEGVLSVEECLARHPHHAQELEPVLLTSLYLSRGHEARLSDGFKARVRTKLMEGMHARPRVRVRAGFPFLRMATSLAVILLAMLAVGTAYAQSALPGDVFYAWKLASENAWRIVSPDPVGTELAIAERRVDELIAVRDDPVLSSRTLYAYLELVARLKSNADAENTARILAALAAQTEELTQSGILLEPPQSDPDVLPPLDEFTPTPTPSTLPVVGTPQLVPTNLPPVAPTIPASEPTVEAPPGIVPTIENLPDVIPTLELPPLP